MTTILSTLSRIAPKSIAAVAAFPLLATSLLSTPANASIPSIAAPAEISTEISTGLYAQTSALTGTWRATDTAVLQMLDTLYGASGAVPERVTGSVYMTFNPGGTVTVAYDNLTMYMPDSEDIPPITLRGNLDLTYTQTDLGNLSFTGVTQNLEAEVMGFTMPAPEVPNGTTLAGYTVDTEVLTFEGLDGDPVYFPNTWLRTY